MLLAFKPSADGNPEHHTLRLQKVAGKVVAVELETQLKITAAEETSMTEDQPIAPVTTASLRVRIGPYETMTLCLTIPHPHKVRSKRWWEW